MTGLEREANTADCMRKNLPAASLIIPTRNRPRLLIDTVQSVLAGGEVPAELVIIDQSTKPLSDLSELATKRACKVRYLWTRSTGLSRARNAGIAAATHDVIAFTDDDMIVPPSWFSGIVGALAEAGENSVVTGPVLATEAETPGGFAPSTNPETVRSTYEGRIGGDVLAAGNMAIYRTAFTEIGVFDQRLGAGSRFPSSEDNDFGFRLLEAGYQVVYAPEALIYHRAWRASREYWSLRWGYGFGQGAYYAKHLSRHDSYMLDRLRWDVMRHYKRVLPRIRTKTRRSIGDIVYATAVLSGAATWLLTQRMAARWPSAVWREQSERKRVRSG